MSTDSNRIRLSIIGKEFGIGQNYDEAYNNLKEIYSRGISEFNEGDTLVCAGSTSITFGRNDKVTSIVVDYNNIKYAKAVINGIQIKGTLLELIYGISFVTGLPVEVIDKDDDNTEKVYLLENIEDSYEVVILNNKLGSKTCKIQPTGTFKHNNKIS